MSLLGSANDSVNLVKAALDAKTSLATAEEKERLAEAKFALADLKEMLADLKEENRSLREKLSVKDQLKPERGHEWLYKNDDEDATRRYCQICYYDADKTIPLNVPYQGPHNRHPGERWCPKCEAYRA